MNTPEIKVGQKYRVVDAEAVGFSALSDGDVVEVLRIDELTDVYKHGYVSSYMFLDSTDIALGYVELVEDAQEAAEAPTDIQSGLSAELLWKFIEGSGDYNGHKQFEIKELPWDVLKESVRVLGDYLETDEDTLASSLEIRLMYNGDSGKFAGTWSASVYQLYYWSDGEHRDGHKDRLLFGVEIVRGI